ncbi:MarR family winged helix-turn-helix transcriptional regulator [Nocardioides sp. Bht2]|uniref:MarR family winged helix-turn-helix transcriptional regulator n=1 Tax=Nocardioides sp. Bht2 TaxID=3392297 RepID=UPI0039B67ED6
MVNDPGVPRAVAVGAHNVPCDDSVSELAIHLFAVARTLRSVMHRNAVNGGLRRGDAALLRALVDLGAMRPSQLATHLGIGASAVSRHLALLTEAELVSRDRDPDDRRAEIVEITDEGRARLVELKQTYIALMRDYFGDWDQIQMREAAQTLKHIADAMTTKNMGDATAALRNEEER